MTPSGKEEMTTSAEGERTEGDARGELVTESSAEIMEMLRGRFRVAALMFVGTGVMLLAIGLVLALVLEVAWWLYIAFLAGAAFLFFFGVMFVWVYLGVPRLQVYEGGVMLKVSRGRSTFRPWSGFEGYRLKRMADIELVELHPRGEGDPVAIHEYVARYEDVKELVEVNLEPIDRGAPRR